MEKIILESNRPIKMSLKKYPNEPYTNFELPVRYNRGYFQVWLGWKWHRIDVEEMD